MRLIDADALMPNAEYKGKNDFVSARDIANAPTIPAPRWARCEDELPDDGEWAIFTNGKVVTVERFKLDAYNHFFPASQWFDFEDAIAWMPLFSVTSK